MITAASPPERGIHVRYMLGSAVFLQALCVKHVQWSGNDVHTVLTREIPKYSEMAVKIIGKCVKT